MYILPFVPLLAGFASAAPQLGDFANLVPAIPGAFFGVADSTRKSPGNGPVKITNAERFATGTTPGASNDGKVGVILENDLTGATTPGAKFVKRYHGPYTLRAGKMWDWFAGEVPPCKDCYITAMQAGLENPDGTKANIDSGAWLHHTVMLELGESIDAVCKIPGVGGAPLSSTKGVGRRLFASGNERTTIRLNHDGKWGIKIGNNSLGFGFALELMNAANKNLPVKFTMSYEYVDGDAAKDYKEVTPVWMDITGCGVSSAPAKDGIYQYTSPTYTSEINGTLVESAGHVHDGGTDTTLFINGKQACVNKMLYGHRRPGYGPMPQSLVMKAMAMDDNQPDTHISDSGVCYDFGQVKKGDKLQITANYDQTLHPQFARNGVQDPIMGISLVYVGQN